MDFFEDYYDHQDMIRDFSMEEIVGGLEAALTEPVKGYREEEPEEYVIYTGEFRKGSHGSTLQAEVVIDEDYGELVETDCTCAQFLKNHFSCEHICAILGKYILDHEYDDEIMESEIFEELKKKTGVENPLLPGVLRKTDSSLQAFFKAAKGGNAKLDKPAWVQGDALQVKTGQISLEVILNVRNGYMTVELKAGPKRHFVIRNLQKFCSSYRKNEKYVFANSTTAAVGKSHMVEEDKVIMEYLSRICEMDQRDTLGYSLYYSGSNDYYREIRLAGSDLDRFMEILDGHKVTVGTSSGKDMDVVVDLAGVPSSVNLEKQEYGAVLHVQDQLPLACGMDYMYLAQKDKIFRLSADEWEQRKSLALASASGNELYIQNKDLPAIAPELVKLGVSQEVLSQLELAAYIHEEPKIQLYLDQPQEDMLTCEVKAFYPAAETTYNVLDQRKDKKKRNLPSEQAAGEQIWGFFAAFDEQNKQMCLPCDDGILYTFLTETIPALSEYGEVFISDQLKKFKVRPAGEVNVGIQVDAGSLVMSLHSNSMSKDEMIQVLSAYNAKKRFTRLKNGEFVVIPEQNMELWKTMAETYKEYGKKNPEAMKLPLFRALYLQESLQDRENLQVEAGENYQKLIRELKAEENWSDEVPESLQSILREYQKEGFQWMKMLKRNGFGGILADDMGLGKTLQVLAFLLSEKIEKSPMPTLIVAPASLIYNWKKEIERFTPELSCTIVAGSIAQRKELIGQIKEDPKDVYITSYDLLKRDILLYEGIPFAHQFIDEAQYIKNQNTQVAKSVRLIDSAFRMALTGTPIENRLSELWSIFDYLMPGFLYGYTRFRQDFESPVINDRDEVVMQRLRSMVHPFILRRLKKDVLKDLPDKIEETVTVNLEGEQRKIYDAYAERLRLFLDKTSDEDFHQKKLEILAELTRLRQICCGPDIFLQGYQGENAKKETCMELLHSALDGGHKVLLFSQFTSVLDDLGNRLAEEGITYHRIDGSVTKEARMRLVESFATDEVPLFLISLKAGGTGLNLTAADIVIHYDPWWNVAAQNQATDRTHRIGQTNKVTVYQLIAEKTIEEQIANLQKTKAQLAEDILSGEGIASIMIDKATLGTFLL